MPQYYLHVATESVRGRRLAAVCYGLVEGGGETARFHELLADEWGEKEILRKMKELGLFELGRAFMPLGPNLEEDLGFLVSRAVHHSILRLDDGLATELIGKKLEGLQEKRGYAASSAQKGDGIASKVETNRQLVERLCSEAASFLKEQSVQ